MAETSGRDKAAKHSSSPSAAAAGLWRLRRKQFEQCFGRNRLRFVPQPINLGSGGGYGAAGRSAVGGAGGGRCESLPAAACSIDGVISANGADATNSRSGGGSGGSIWLTAQSISGAGLIRVNGGAGEPIHGGGGGGGRIALEADTNNFAGLMTAYGGAGAQIGGAGTIYTKLTAQNGTVLVDNGGSGRHQYSPAGGERRGPHGSWPRRGHDQWRPERGKAARGVEQSDHRAQFFPHRDHHQLRRRPSNPVDALPSTAWASSLESDPARVIRRAPEFISVAAAGMAAMAGWVATPMRAAAALSVQRPGRPHAGGAGAGSGSSFSPFGGLGGGAIRMTVNGKLIVNGSISADGKPGSGSYAGGGAGGSVWLTRSGPGLVQEPCRRTAPRAYCLAVVAAEADGFPFPSTQIHSPAR